VPTDWRVRDRRQPTCRRLLLGEDFPYVFKPALAGRTARLNPALSLRSVRAACADIRGRAEAEKDQLRRSWQGVFSSSASVNDRADWVKAAARTTTPAAAQLLDDQMRALQGGPEPAPRCCQP